MISSDKIINQVYLHVFNYFLVTNFTISTELFLSSFWSATGHSNLKLASQKAGVDIFPWNPSITSSMYAASRPLSAIGAGQARATPIISKCNIIHNLGINCGNDLWEWSIEFSRTTDKGKKLWSYSTDANLQFCIWNLDAPCEKCSSKSTIWDAPLQDPSMHKMWSRW